MVSTESEENKKKTVAKYDLQWGFNPGPLPFKPFLLLCELIIHLLLDLRTGSKCMAAMVFYYWMFSRDSTKSIESAEYISI